MRIIGGTLKRRKLRFPKTYATRPVTDRAKETIFNVLGTLCEGAIVLDLFAGSGSLGIEALSRGAKEVYFVDSARIAVSCIERNLGDLVLTRGAHVLQLTVPGAISNLKKQDKKFDLIFLDPPHNKGLIKKILNVLGHSDILNSFGTIVVGHSNHEGLPEHLEKLRCQRSIKLGQTFISFLERQDKV
ncbi:MAG: 16S rRNA (guanine(966)-N(2))-methyltransferase RsmD [Omnitrophica bacterium RIFCSPHIGHO2_02_FULL_46_11]|nr:MAG: 16S rRNA (guanine(966)-N(2))-methyltransferase RsmD [Omnitrophica bacterium RIFCSPLOWO2_01_FULL_45_10b]OGW87426.1 MAG: 16S rRNA (guanine(966)-N(2))-methyltransferase RsmD [Omnitrophica bacterium RIFCSPHIGHO2_02_FULL_46_11]